MSDYLPTEAVIEILARLPVKTLGQCRSVCKSWRSLITDPFFINKQLHINYPISASSRAILQFRCDRMVCYSLLSGSQVSEEPKTFLHPTEVPLRIAGCSNGVFCLWDDRINNFSSPYHVVLWNPSIRKVKFLARSQSQSVQSRHSYLNGGMVIGFGFVPQDSDFKLVQILFRYPFVSPIVEVYTLSTDTWRRKEFGDNIHHCRFMDPAHVCSLYFKGFIHWKACKRRQEEGSSVKELESVFILSFHMTDEIFREIALPPHKGECQAISALQGSLALFVRYSNSQTSNAWDIWVMKDYGIVNSWTKLYSIRDIIGYPFEFLSDGQVLLRRSEYNLISFDPTTKELTNLKMPPYGSLMVAYYPSLALFNEGIDVIQRGQDTAGFVWYME